MSDKIVVIEDNPDVRNNLKEILESAGYSVETAENGEIGLEVLKRTMPDLILCDIMMPELDGYGLLKAVRSSKVLASTPFVFLTAKTAREDLSKGMELGADDYIMKPFTIAELLKRVRIRLDKRKEVLERSEQKIKEVTSNIGQPITHELNEPLRTITGIGELIMTEHYGMEKAEIVEFVSLIHKAGLELKEVVGKTLNYYEVEELKNNRDLLDQLKSEAITSPKLIINDLVTSEAEEYRRASDVVVSLVDTEIQFPAKYFKTTVSSILSNAFKFSPRGSMVRVITGIEDKHFVLTVSDEGLGMEEEDVASIGAYKKFDDGSVKKGLGLGLFNTSRTLDMFDASMSINSNKGIGTIVKLKFKVVE